MTAAAAEASGRGAGPPDLRLALPAVAAWLAALLALLTSPTVAAGITATAGLVAGGMLAATAWRPRRWLTVTAGVAVCAAAAAAAAGLRLATVRAEPLRSLAARHAFAVVDAVVTDDPHIRAGCVDAPERCRRGLVVRARAVRVQAAGRLLRVRVPVVLLAGDGAGRLMPGMRVRVAGRLLPPRPGDVLAAVVSVRGPPRATGTPSAIQRVATRIRAGLRAAVAVLPQPERGVLPGLVLGDTSQMTPGVQTVFRAAGLSHLTAVSGANLAVTVGALVALTRLLRIGPAGTVLLGVPATLAFVVVARPSPSVLRAAVMGVLALLAIGTGRERVGLPALCVTVLGLILADPELAASYGFALSVLATAGILVLAPTWRARLARRLPRRWAEAVAVSAAAQVACAPVLAMMSAGVSLVAVPANLLAEPAVAPATVLGVLATLLAPFAMPLARLLVWPAGAAVGWIVKVAEAAAAIPHAALPWPGGTSGALLLLAAGAGFAVVLAHGRWRAVGAAAAVGVLLAAATLRVLAPGWPPAGWLLVACDVGQGDALALAAGPASAVVVDTGPDPDRVDRCLRRLGVSYVPLLVITHAHADHVGGLAGVLRGRTVGSVVTSPFAVPRAEYTRMLVLLAGRGIRAYAAVPGQRWAVGPLRLTVLGPRPRSLAFAAGAGDASGPNDASVVLLAHHAALSALLTGDVEQEAQHDLLTAGSVPRVTLLKVPHHGSADQDPRFLAAAGARIAVTSVGAGNPYGHPAPATLACLRALGARVYRTDHDGDIAVIADRHGLAVVVRRARGPPRPHGMLRVMSASGVAPVNVVVGDEELLVERAVSEIIAGARTADAEIHDLTPAMIGPGDLIELTSPSLFGGRRVVVVRSAQDLGKEVANEIGAYAAAPADDIVLVLTHAGGVKGKALLETLTKAGARIVSCPKITRPSERIDFVRAEIRRFGRTVTEDAARALLDAVGTDLRELAAACSQMCADTEGTIDEEAVARYYRGRAEASGFTVADRAVEGRLGDALEQVRWALGVGVAPVLITSALAQGLRSLAKVGGAPRGLRGPALARELGMPAWKIDRVRQQLRGWSAEGVARALRAVAEADAQVKGGGTDPAYALERAVQKIVDARAAR